MELQRALSQISEIHAQVLKQELFEGFRAVTMATTGLIAVLAAAVQSSIWTPLTPADYAWYWIIVAVLCTSICAADLLLGSRLRERDYLKRRTIPVLVQFVPAVVVGALLTWGILNLEPATQILLPGLWAFVYSLGLFSSRPYLPRAVGWVGAFYMLAGTVLLMTAGSSSGLSPWGMGVTFGLGQLGFALVLHINLERGER
ncbi:MAG: hypothetical protein ACYTG5_02210 [Planctomycetota bacterium]|jgi:hypothetical protein